MPSRSAQAIPNASNRLFYLCAVTINDFHGSSNSGKIEMYLPSAARNDEVFHGTEERRHVYWDQKIYKQEKRYQLKQN